MQNTMKPDCRMCYFPFTNLTVNPVGNVTPCCKYNLNQIDTEITKETLYTMNFEELFHQPAMEKIREDFRNGIEPDGCKICWDEEASGVKSLRHLRETMTTGRLANQYVGRFDDPKLLTLDLKFSSLCNLKCRVCGPYCSSNWIQESLDTGIGGQANKDWYNKCADRKFSKNSDNYNILKKMLPDLHVLEFYGGEPLMQPEHKIIMDIIRENNVNKDLHLFYNTNGTIYDHASLEAWKKAMIVELNISIDDIGRRYEYQRHPAKWDHVLANIKKYSDTVGKNVVINLYCTVSLFNIWYIDEFLRFNSENLKLPIRFNLVHWPSKMSIKNLPPDIKEKVNEKLHKLSYEDKKYISPEFNIEAVVKFMNANTMSQIELLDFMKTVGRHDQYRNENFSSTFDEFHSLLNPYVT